jgi:RNA polymerase sigma-70 factor (ECF subfamily)
VEDLEQLDRTWTQWAERDDGETLLEALRECLEGLSERARLALELRYREQCTRATIADRLRLTEDGAKNLLQRAKQKLRHCIEGKLG